MGEGRHSEAPCVVHEGQRMGLLVGVGGVPEQVQAAMFVVAVEVGVVIELRPAPEVDHVVGREVFVLDHLSPFDPALQQGPRCRRDRGERSHAVAALLQDGSVWWAAVAA